MHRYDKYAARLNGAGRHRQRAGPEGEGITATDEQCTDTINMPPGSMVSGSTLQEMYFELMVACTSIVSLDVL